MIPLVNVADLTSLTCLYSVSGNQLAGSQCPHIYYLHNLGALWSKRLGYRKSACRFTMSSICLSIQPSWVHYGQKDWVHGCINVQQDWVPGCLMVQQDWVRLKMRHYPLQISLFHHSFSFSIVYTECCFIAIMFPFIVRL